MIIQSGRYDCGPASIVNACAAIGVTVSLDDAKKLTGATWEGVDEDGIKRGLELLRFQPVEVTSYDRLCNCLWIGQPVIAYMPDRDHWLAVIGRCGGWFQVADSASEEIVEAWDPHTWIAAWRDENGGCYGIALAR